MLSVHKSSPRDSAAIAALLERSYNTLYPACYPPEVLAVALPLLVQPKAELLAGGTFYLVSQAAEVVACGGWSEADPGTGAVDKGLAHVRQFATHPDYLRKGAASLIMAACLRDAQQAGISQFDCLSSLAAEAFYGRFGFTAVARDTIMLSGKLPFDVVRMKKSI